MAIYNSAVCNCHKDDEFTPLFDLVNRGYLFVNKTKSISERISFGVKLRKALNEFTKRFVPHMKEEEEV
jgi:F-box/leucine-rich repeat protein 5